MEKAKLILFTSPTCPHCSGAKKHVEEVKKSREDVVVEEYSTVTKEGSKEAQKYGVMSVPTVIILGPEAENPIGLKGSQPAKVINKYIDKSYNRLEEEEKEKKSLRDKLREGIKIGKLRIKI